MKKNLLELVGLTIEDITREVYQFTETKKKIEYLDNVYTEVRRIREELEDYFGNWEEYLENNKNVDNSLEGQGKFLGNLEPWFESIISNHIIKYFLEFNLQPTLYESNDEFDGALDELAQFHTDLEHLYTKIHLIDTLVDHKGDSDEQIVVRKQLKDGGLVQHIENFWKLEGRDIHDSNDDSFLMPEEKERMKEYCEQYEGVEYKNFRSKLRTMGMIEYDHHMKNRNVY